MKFRRNIRTLLFAAAALSFPGSIIASTNLKCKIDCPSLQIEVKKDSHACCPKFAKTGKSVEKISRKCDNCIENQEIPAALSIQSQPIKVEAIAVSDVVHIAKFFVFENKVVLGRSFHNSPFYSNKSVSITLHRFLI